MIFLCTGVSLNRDLAASIFRTFAENPDIVKGSIRIESSEETLSHQECNIMIQNLAGDCRVGSQFFHEFYSHSEPRELLFIEADDPEQAGLIADFIAAELDCELTFIEYPDAESAGL